jgi:hypothetical protein
VPRNGWIVVDANLAPGGQPNGSLQLLERYAREDSFKVIAIIITHFHTDHYSGVAEILGLCERLAGERKVPLGDLLDTVVLPQEYDHFYEFVESATGKPGRRKHDKARHRPAKAGSTVGKPGKSHLRALLDRLESLRKHGVGITTLSPMTLPWTETASEPLKPDEPWVVNLFPAPVEVNREFFSKKGRFRVRSLSEIRSALSRNANRYVYVLGVGYGLEPQHFHFLLTSDLPGDVFTDLTTHLRDEILPVSLSRSFGAPREIKSLILRVPAEEGGTRLRFRPVQGITVPHHGSGRNPALCADLEWWLDERCGTSECPALAVVQGGKHALQINTVEELFKARLDVLATTYPEAVAQRYTVCRELDERLSVPLAPPRAPLYPIGSMPSAPQVPPHIAVHGGPGGIHRIDLRGVYRIHPRPPAALPAAGTAPASFIPRA